MAALVAGLGTAGPSRRSDASAAQEGARRAGRSRAGQDVSQRAKDQDCAGAAGTKGAPAAGKDLWPAGASAARGRLREPTKRRKLTSRDRDKRRPRRHQPPAQKPVTSHEEAANTVAARTR